MLNSSSSISISISSTKIVIIMSNNKQERTNPGRLVTWATKFGVT